MKFGIQSLTAILVFVFGIIVVKLQSSAQWNSCFLGWPLSWIGWCTFCSLWFTNDSPWDQGHLKWTDYMYFCVNGCGFRHSELRCARALCPCCCTVNVFHVFEYFFSWYLLHSCCIRCVFFFILFIARLLHSVFWSKCFHTLAHLLYSFKNICSWVTCLPWTWCIYLELYFPYWKSYFTQTSRIK